MERESFEDIEVAQLLNRDYIAIKVDREERPDIDTIYMRVCQAMTGHGGWPLTIIMTPDKKPFYAATYLPKDSRGSLMGLTEILPVIKKMWDSDPEKVLESSEKISAWLNNAQEKTGKDKVEDIVFVQALDYYKRNFDASYGGFGRAPKFPAPHNLFFLLRYYFSHGDAGALQMGEKTLDAMYRGGIYDHLGFGFARYSTDQMWLAPHFEKMLYDNALLAIAYLEYYQLTRKPLYARVAREIFSYVLRDMTSPEGGFYSAEDADSEGVEGKFYLWNPREVKEVLGEEDGSFFCRIYDISSQGNFEGASIPNLIKDMPDDKEQQRLENLRERLFAQREKRIHPFKDDKILCSWNALMIAALSFGARVLNESSYLDAARRAVDFIMEKMRRSDGRLLASYREGQALYPAYVDDYAYLVWALLELYEASYETNFLLTALDLNRDMLRYFWDEKNGGLFFYGSDSEQLLTRPKEIYDGAMPSGNSAAALNFARLARLTGDIQLEEKLQQQLSCFAPDISAIPAAHAFFLGAAMFAGGSDQQIVIVGNGQDHNTQLMLQAINECFNPFSITMFKDEGQVQEHIAQLSPFLEEMYSINGEAAAYICSHYACQEPITSPGELRKQLNSYTPV